MIENVRVIKNLHKLYTYRGLNSTRCRWKIHTMYPAVWTPPPKTTATNISKFGVKLYNILKRGSFTLSRWPTDVDWDRILILLGYDTVNQPGRWPYFDLAASTVYGTEWTDFSVIRQPTNCTITLCASQSSVSACVHTVTKSRGHNFTQRLPSNRYRVPWEQG